MLNIIKNLFIKKIMGLDQYLYKKMYVGNKYKEPEKQVKIDIEGVKQERVSEITEEVMYWRKANQIHNWFETHCGFGDNGSECYVTRDNLVELLKTIDEVLKKSKLVKGKVTNSYRFEGGKMVPTLIDGKKIKNPKTAMKLLPVTEGFFYGSYEYDQYYISQLKYTKKELEKLVEEKDGDYYYSADW